jgi:DNA-binding NarL/FixJ family response regulator
MTDYLNVSNIKVAIVEDNEIIRKAVTMFVKHTPDFECVGVFENSEDALLSLPQICPDVVLMDIGLPGINGIECVRRLKSLCDKTQFLMITVFEDDDNIFEALKAGATGYLIKKTPPAEIVSSIKELHAGGSPMSGAIARRVISQFQTPAKSESMNMLSEREQQILNLLSKGFRYKEIGDQLNISFSTVRTHIHNIYEKLQVQSRTEALNKVFPRS